MTETTHVALQVILRAARETATARRIGGDAETALLQSVVDAAATIFAAEASSIALFEPDPDRLVFRVAGGEQGDGVVGISVAPTHGIVGYVFSTGEPIALEAQLYLDHRFRYATSPRMTIRARIGYWPICVGASAFHTPHGKLPT